MTDLFCRLPKAEPLEVRKIVTRLCGLPPSERWLEDFLNGGRIVGFAPKNTTAAPRGVMLNTAGEGGSYTQASLWVVCSPQDASGFIDAYDNGAGCP